MRGEIEWAKEEIRKSEENWEKEREEMMGKLEQLELEEKIKELAKGRRDRKESGWVVGVDERVQVMEKKWEMKEREERRSNIIIKNIMGVAGDIQNEVEEIIKVTAEGVKIGAIKRVRRENEGGKGMVISILDNIEQKRRIMEGRRKLEGRVERIEDDLTWKERKMQWELKRIASVERGRRKRVCVGYDKIQIEGTWRGWNEDEEGVIPGVSMSDDSVDGDVGRTEGMGKNRSKATKNILVEDPASNEEK
ncbi:hypothetical protein WN55_03030 [Dufourea novaeangliae]|uniref:Uncharacterized protein n=1 Tax=Dufourea novaeangliae TaxID=178035 RepID=A0A154PHV3_DUFNO|nr:hypothetical protein WN55_03030 [Dufourea novaeangliae]